jgi:hypothetical protein
MEKSVDGQTHSTVNNTTDSLNSSLSLNNFFLLDHIDDNHKVSVFFID